MAEPTLVELIEAYDVVDIATSKMAGESKRNGETWAEFCRLNHELACRIGGLDANPLVIHKGTVYVIDCEGDLRVYRNVRSADEIDREGKL